MTIRLNFNQLTVYNDIYNSFEDSSKLQLYLSHRNQVRYQNSRSSEDYFVKWRLEYQRLKVSFNDVSPFSFKFHSIQDFLKNKAVDTVGTINIQNYYFCNLLIYRINEMLCCCYNGKSLDYYDRVLQFLFSKAFIQMTTVRANPKFWCHILNSCYIELYIYVHIPGKV